MPIKCGAMHISAHVAQKERERKIQPIVLGKSVHTTVLHTDPIKQVECMHTCTCILLHSPFLYYSTKLVQVHT